MPTIVFLSICSWYGFTSISRGGTGRGLFAGYIIASIALLYTHLFGSFIMLAQGVLVIGWLIIDCNTSKSSHPAKRIFGLLAITGVAFLPWLVTILPTLTGFSKTGGEQIGLYWVSAPTIWSLFRTAVKYTGVQYSQSPFNFVLFPMFFGCIGLGWWQLKDRLAGVILSVWAVVPVAMPFLLSYLIEPMYVPRYTLTALPALLIFLATGLVYGADLMAAIVKGETRKEPRRGSIFAVVFAVLLLLMASPVAGYYTTEHHRDWRQSAEWIDNEGNPGDMVLVSRSINKRIVEYHLDRDDLQLVGIKVNPYTGEAETPGNVSVVVNGHDRVWVHLARTRGDAQFILDTLNETHDFQKQRTFRTNRGDVRVYLYTKPG